MSIGKDFTELGSLITSNWLPRNQEKPETWKDHNGRIKKDDREQDCVLRDEGYNHPHPHILDYYVQM